MRPLTVIQVGAGSWGRSWAEIVARSPGFRLAGLVDAAPAARDWAAAELGTTPFRTLDRALAAVEADAVLLVSPPVTHRPLAETAVAAGCHVLVEKPLALEMRDAVALADLARVSGRQVLVAQNYRFRRQSRALQKLVRGGVLGRLHGARIRCRRDLRSAWITRRDWRGRMPHPYLLDMAVHHLDLLRAITGREIETVDARGWTVPDSPFKHEPTVSALLTLDDGTPVAYEGDWATPGAETSWNGDWELVGARGRATWTGGVANALRGEVRVEAYGSPPRRHELPRLRVLDRLACLHELKHAATTGEKPECAVADNVRTLAAVLAVARSVDERRPVTTAEVLAG